VSTRTRVPPPDKKDAPAKTPAKRPSTGKQRAIVAQSVPQSEFTSSGAPARIVHVVGELAPYARTGGLGEAVATLARFQAQAGLDVAIIVPFYREIANKKPSIKPLGDPFDIPIADRVEHAQLFEVTKSRTGAQPRVIFVANATYFDRDGIYGDASGDFVDNARRYAFFCLAALRAMPMISDAPVVLHAHDWHTALTPVYLRSWFRNHQYYRQISTVLSVHNAGFQGHFPTASMHDLGLPWELYNLHQLEWYGRVNFLKGGMSFSDVVTTVSPTHAQELKTPGGGFGLHDAFRALGNRFIGITNGIDLQVWTPSTDTQIAATYSREDLSGKARCKASLQRLFALPIKAGIPVFGMSSRMVYQKGLDLIFGSDFLSLDAQFVFLGAGEAKYERILTDLARTYPDRIGVQTNFTDRLEHKLLAGADLCLMPSMYEPCGLTQMRAQRYGTLPLARRVGGLADTVEDGVTGFLFDDYTSDSFTTGARRAVATYHDEHQWRTMQQAAMARDFGWERSEREYAHVYRFALERNRAITA
jgi:starch synthase